MPTTILNEEFSIKNITSDPKCNTDFFTKTLYFNPTFKMSKYRSEQQKFIMMFSFQHSQITQEDFEQLADLLRKYPKIYATSKFIVGKAISPLHLPLKPEAVFKKLRASRVPIHLPDKVNRILDIIEEYEILSHSTKKNNQKGSNLKTVK